MHCTTVIIVLYLAIMHNFLSAITYATAYYYFSFVLYHTCLYVVQNDLNVYILSVLQTTLMKCLWSSCECTCEVSLVQL